MCVNLNQQYFKNTKFYTSVFDYKLLPPLSSKEVAFAGRSNCGKSSIINAITNKKNLAITSKTPGRTTSINYFHIANNNYLVDLPGYGYAKVSDKTKIFWATLLEQYLANRTNLVGIILIMDLRHPLTNFDKQMLLFCFSNNLPLHLVLNKSDKLPKHQINQTMQLVYNTISKDLPSITNISIQPFSAFKKYGVTELQDQIIKWLQTPST